MKFYATTPIYYVNDVPHIGHSYTSIAVDCLSRFMRLSGREVFFLTGTDEHGQKIERAACELGLTPQELADQVVGRFVELWKVLRISYDGFIRTTEPRHRDVVQEVFLKIKERGDIYKGRYYGQYCTPCETFWTEKQITDGCCPSCGRETEWVSEECFFFRMSRYKETLLRYIQDENPDFIQPPSRRAEVENIISEGLRDLCITRRELSWGVPIPVQGEPGVIYVWFDALLNYLSGIRGLGGDDSFQRFWPADVHVIGKDILKFHAIIWPCMLLSAGLSPPRQVFAHGWWTIQGCKMSKSLGNVVDPWDVVRRYGVDPYRYFLLREVPFGQDGDFSEAALRARINSDLSNDLGNLVHRVLGMVSRYAQSRIPSRKEVSAPIREICLEVVKDVEREVTSLAFSRALVRIWDVVHFANRFVDSQAPWVLARDKSRKDELDSILYSLLEVLRFLGVLLSPFIPDSAKGIFDRLGISGRPELLSLASIQRLGLLPSGGEVWLGEPLFPRV